MQALTSVTARQKSTLQQLLSFGMVGLVGFFIDASVLHVCVMFGTGLYLGRMLSYLCSVTSTWMLNRRYTFDATRRSGELLGEWARYAVSQLSGGAVNLGTYALLVSTSTVCAAYPGVAVAAGSLAGMLINYTVARSFIFSPSSSRAL